MVEHGNRKTRKKLVGEMLIDYKTILMMEPSSKIKFFRKVSSAFPCGSSVSNERERNLMVSIPEKWSLKFRKFNAIQPPSHKEIYPLGLYLRS